MRSSSGANGGRPMIMSARGVVSSGHYLATEIGLDALRRGGNAMDAAVATGFALAVLQPHMNGIAGEAPMLVYCADERRVRAISGHGVAPRAATLEKFAEYGLEVIPGDGFLPAVVPATVGGYIYLLGRFGTMRLKELLEPSIVLASDGFVMYDALHRSISASADRFKKEWPSSAEVFLPGGAPPPVGSVWRQPDWAETFARLVRADERFKKREEGLRAAYDEFYRGKIAESIVKFSGENAIRDASGESHAGLLSMRDFDEYSPAEEEPVKTVYRGVMVYKCSSWTQGPVMLQGLNLLEGFDLAGMGHNSAAYIHTVVECMKLAYADREFYYGDPAFVHVPFDRLLSKEYAAERRALIDAGSASLELRPGGRAAIRAESITAVNDAFARAAGGEGGDTTKLDIIDRRGNMVSVTQSGGWLMSSPVIPGLGFPLGTRGQMFSLVAGHPNCLAPGNQDQWALQFLLNVVEFGMSLQDAVEAPTFNTAHFPGSFYPRTARPGSLTVEGRVAESVRDELAARGHRLEVAPDWSGGNTLAASVDTRAGVLSAGASPRFEPAYAAGL